MSYLGWRQTELWKRLLDRGQSCESLRHYLASWLDEVEVLLAKGGTAPLSFTLHDDEHSFRVAQRMIELVPEQTANGLSDLELGLLLSSAYLHDIGMNPRREVVGQIRDYLLSGNLGGLSDDEARRLQRWLDEAHPGVESPILGGKPLTERLHQAEVLTAFFCRYRHNDWSGDFIVERAKGIKNPPHVNWIQDLVTLCKSHHYGLPRLMDSAFDLRLAGPEGKLVNLRYLAALLRVADVLEFDPERTPQVVLEHRSPGPYSEVYWYKDHEIGLELERGSWSIAMQARTRDPWTHRAVQETADAVDHELENCATIERQNAFLRGRKVEGDEVYIWRWPARLARTIEPMPDTFVPIDGTFRPNAERILALLAGTRLYRTPLAAVRELLQNAFDAVKEQIAWESLQDETSDDSRVREARALLHHVKLVLERDNDGELWLTCSDSGVGMTRRVIEKYLLVSGSQSRPEVLELSRESAARGLRLERSGEFGIGVLSYFMVADRMVIETRAAAGIELDQENHGWRFVTGGLSSVGELRPLARTVRGTSVKLRIKETMKDLFAGEQFRSFVDEAITRAPCVFEFRHLGRAKSFGPGWAWDESDLLRFALDNKLPKLERSEDDLEKSEDHKALIKARVEIRKLAGERLKLFGPFEHKLPGEMGVMRLYVPYFALDDGASVLFFKAVGQLIRRVAIPYDDEDFGVLLDPAIRRSWRGFSTSMAVGEVTSMSPGRYFQDARYIRTSNFTTSLPIAIEMDFLDHATISIDRNSLVVASSGDAPKIFREACVSALVNFAQFQKASPYLEATIAFFRESNLEVPEELKDLSGRYWIFPAEGDEDAFSWREIRFPAVLNLDEPSEEYRLSRRCSEKNRLYRDEVRRFVLDSEIREHPFSDLVPTRLLLFRRDRRFQIALLFETRDTSRVEEELIARFPEKWERLIAIEYNGGMTIYNSQSPWASW
jgi:hypothetical protein